MIIRIIIMIILIRKIMSIIVRTKMMMVKTQCARHCSRKGGAIWKL